MSNETVWAKILADLSEEPHPIGRSGCIPVLDKGSGKTWRIFKNHATIHVEAENCLDPAKVDPLRLNAVSLMEHYPGTIERLEKLGARVKTLLNRPIETYDDVVAWADSLFNTGPTSKYPQHVHETMDLAYDDYVLVVGDGRSPAFVIPAAPRGSELYVTLDFSVPGLKARYGPRHEFTKEAFSKQTPKKQPKPPRYRGKTVEGEPRRPRGRPRKDGLAPGSSEARRADRKKEREREARRAARELRRARLEAAQAPKKKPGQRLARLAS